MNYSVVIPFFNNGEEISVAIESVLSQSIPPKQIVIVDDNSTKKASAFLSSVVDSTARLDLITILHHETNQGVSNSRNNGISACLNQDVDFIAFCDSDDAWHVDKMKKQLPMFCHEKVLAVACGLEGSKLLKLLPSDSIISLSLYDLLFRNYIQPSTLVVRSTVFSRLECFFPPGRRYAEEGDLYNRIVEKGTLLFLSSPLVIYDTRASIQRQSINQQATHSVRLSKNLINMYLGNIYNLYNCYRRRGLNIFSFLFFLSLMVTRFVFRLSIVVFGRLLNIFIVMPK